VLYVETPNVTDSTVRKALGRLNDLGLVETYRPDHARKATVTHADTSFLRRWTEILAGSRRSARSDSILSRDFAVICDSSEPVDAVESCYDVIFDICDSLSSGANPLFTWTDSPPTYRFHQKSSVSPD
jgi:hypothetical protein